MIGHDLPARHHIKQKHTETGAFRLGRRAFAACRGRIWRTLFIAFSKKYFFKGMFTDLELPVIMFIVRTNPGAPE